MQMRAVKLPWGPSFMREVVDKRKDYSAFVIISPELLFQGSCFDQVVHFELRLQVPLYHVIHSIINTKATLQPTNCDQI